MPVKKENFITVMAILDDKTQASLKNIQEKMESLYGIDMLTRGIPFHITLGSYALEESNEIVSRIHEVAKQTERFGVKFKGINHFGDMIRFIEPELNENLFKLHKHFDSDYANGFDEWVPHVTLYRHSEPTEIRIPEEITDALEQLTDATIIGIELGEFFPMKTIESVLFDK